MYGIEIPDEFPGHISCGEFGKGITTLDLRSLCCRLPTLTSMTLSLSNLKKLRIKHYGTIPERPLPTYPVTPERGPLDLLELLGHVDEIGETLTESRLTSRHLSLDVCFTNMGRLVSLFSETVVELKLCGAWSLWILRRSEIMMTDLPDTSTNGIPTLINLPPLPALTTLVVGLHVYTPSPRLTSILCSIDSAPALSSVAIEYNWKCVRRLCPRALWVDVDRWLSRISKQTKVTGGLSLTLIRWPEGKSVWEGFLPEFRESGGQIKVDNSV